MSGPASESPSRLYFATSNMGKLAELRALFARTHFTIELFDGYASPVEGIDRYTDNAALKARALHTELRRRGMASDVIADDSGLEVYALGGRPGVVTADYGGPGLSWSGRRAKLLDELDAVETDDRRARFVCAMHYIAADGRELGALGTVDGEIAPTERGTLGFSFDPVFLYPPAGKTFAQLSDAEKNRVSHRAVAAAGIIAAIAAAAERLP